VNTQGEKKMILASGALVRAPFFRTAALAMGVSAFLAACGGGGGGDAGPPAGFGSTPTSPSPVARPLAPGAELPPTLRSPQPGSTVLTGNDTQGIYENMHGFTFVSSKGRLIYKDVSQWIFGSVEIDGSNWKFRVPTMSRDSRFDRLDLVSGSGKFEFRKSMNGSYTRYGENSASQLSALTYSAANALAVTQNDLAGKWTADSADFGMSIEVDASGAITGRTTGSQMGMCNLSGTIVQTESGTSRNLFDVRFSVTNAASGAEKACYVPDGRTFVGLGGVVMLPVSIFDEEGAYRTLYFHSATDTFAVLTNGLRKQ